MEILDKFQSTSKINLFLDVMGKDALDGYHFLESIFVEIPWGDDLKICTSKKDVINFTNISNNVISEDNTISKALELFKKKYHIQDCFKIEIKKNVPLGAGLGGGSGDAGALLKWLAHYYKIDPLSCIDIAQKVGSDVPFFLYGKTALVEGKGEKITPLRGYFAPNTYIMIIYPGIQISTQKAFQILNIRESAKKKSSIPDFFLKKQFWDIDTLKKIIYNIFDNRLESLSFELYDQKKYIQNTLSPDFIWMTGSGSSFILLFKKKISLDLAMSYMDNSLNCPIYFIQAI